MKKVKSVVCGIFITAVLAFMLPIIILSWIDRFENPGFYAPFKLDYDKKQAELQQILDTITVGLPSIDKRVDYKKTDAQSISIAYHYHNPKTNDIETLLENIQQIADVELPTYDTSSYSFIRKFCLGENEISAGDYNFDGLYQIRLYVHFYRIGDCRRFVYEKSRQGV